jgi:uncharacterized protein
MRKNPAKPESHGLQFNVAQLLKEPTGATRNYEVNTPVPDTLDAEISFVSPLTGHVKFLRTGLNILVTGALTGTIKKNCGRCLNSFTVPVSLELEEQFYPTIDVVTGTPLTQSAEVEEFDLIDEQHILDLLEVVRQEFLVNSDEPRYCRPDCKGLCPICGQDRNTTSCNCQDEVIDARWADLQTLLEE